MSYIVGNTQEQKEWINAQEGVHNAVCVDIVDLGMVEGFQGKERHKMRLVFEVEELHPTTGEPLIVSQQYGVSLHENANLRKDLEKWRGKPFSPEELQRFDLERLIGVSCQVVVSQNYNDTNQQTYANVDNILKAKVTLAPSGYYVRRKDRDDWLEPKRSPWNKGQQRNQQQRQQRSNNQQAQQTQRPSNQAQVPTQRVNRPQPAPAQQTAPADVPSAF
jgi:hypothetical protein